MSNLFKFVNDETNGLFKVYDNDVFLVDVPYFAYGSPFVFFNTNFSIACCGLNFIDIIYHFADFTTIKDYSFDFSGIFTSVEVGTFFDLGVWNNAYTTDLFWATRNALGDFQSLNEVNMTFNQTTLIATGLNYGLAVPVPVDSGVSLVLRSQKGSPLTHNQLDENFIFLNSKIENFDLNIQDFHQSLNDFTVFKNLAPFSLNRLSLSEDKIKLFELYMPVYVGLDYNSRTVAYFDLFLHIYNSSGNPAFEQFRVFRNVPITYTYDEANDILTFVDVSNDISFNIGFVYNKISNKMICFLPVGSPTWDALAKCTFSVCTAYDISFYETFDFVATVS